MLEMVWRKGNLLPPLVGMQTGTATVERRTEWRFLKKLGLELPHDPAIPLLGIPPWGNQKWNRRMYPNVHSSTIYNSSDREGTYMSNGRWMDKEVVVHIHNGTLLSYKKEHIWISANEVDEPGACFTDRSKLERERQILILMPIYGI